MRLHQNVAPRTSASVKVSPADLCNIVTFDRRGASMRKAAQLGMISFSVLGLASRRSPPAPAPRLRGRSRCAGARPPCRRFRPNRRRATISSGATAAARSPPRMMSPMSPPPPPPPPTARSCDRRCEPAVGRERSRRLRQRQPDCPRRDLGEPSPVATTDERHDGRRHGWASPMRRASTGPGPSRNRGCSPPAIMTTCSIPSSMLPMPAASSSAATCEPSLPRLDTRRVLTVAVQDGPAGRCRSPG